MINYIELSKEISYALRHAPWEYELEMDEEGWVSVEQLLDALNNDEKWESISEKDLIVMIQKSEKKRHDKHPCVLKINANLTFWDKLSDSCCASEAIMVRSSSPFVSIVLMFSFSKNTAMPLSLSCLIY